MDLGDAQDNIVGQSDREIIQNDYVEDVPAFNHADSPARVSQQKIAPAALVGRLMAPLQRFELLTVGPIDVPTGASLLNVTTTSSLQHENIKGFIARQIYVGRFDNLGRMPEVISSSSYPTYEFDSLYTKSNASGLYIGDQPWISVHKIQVRNNSGSTQRFWIQILVTYILNRSNEALT